MKTAHYSSLESGIHPLSIESRDEASDDEGSGKKKQPFRVQVLQRNEPNACRLFMYFGMFILAVTASYLILLITTTFSCQGAPYIYVTHGSSQNIMKFSRDGCLMNPKVLWGFSEVNSELRGMFLGRYKETEALYVMDVNYGVYVFGDCFHDTSMRPLITLAIPASSNPGVAHGYSVKADLMGNIYASFQHTDAVLRFAADTMQPLPIPSNFTAMYFNKSMYQKFHPNHQGSTFFNGSFVQFGDPIVHNKNESGIRDIVWVNNYTQLWIANEDLGAIVVVNTQGKYIDHIPVKDAIGLYTREDLPYVFCSSKKSGTVVAIDKHTKATVHTYALIGMGHPSAMVSHDDTLFVGDQTRNIISTFNITTARFIRQIVSASVMPGAVEQMILSNC